MNHFQIIKQFIKEEGQEKGSVSGAMAMDSLKAIRSSWNIVTKLLHESSVEREPPKEKETQECHECGGTGHVVGGYSVHQDDKERRFVLDVTHCTNCEARKLPLIDFELKDKHAPGCMCPVCGAQPKN